MFTPKAGSKCINAGRGFANRGRAMKTRGTKRFRKKKKELPGGSTEGGTNTWFAKDGPFTRWKEWGPAGGRWREGMAKRT